MADDIHLCVGGATILAPDWGAVAKLNARVAKALDGVAVVIKDGKNMAQNYAYASIEEVSIVARKALTKAGLGFWVTTNTLDLEERVTDKGSHMTRARVNVSLILSDPETGAVMITEAHGYGDDSMDKAANKAFTAAVKYGLMRALLMSTTDDSDADSETDAPQPAVKAQHWIDDEPTRRKFWAWTQSQALTDKDVYGALGVEHIHDYTGTKEDALKAITAYIAITSKRTTQEAAK